MSLMDFSQNEKIDKLERKIKHIERCNNRGNVMSKVINDLVGMDCIIDSDDLYDEKCRIEDFDGEWIRLLVYGKKENKIIIVPIDTIEKFEIV